MVRRWSTMKFFIFFLFLIPATLPSCPKEPVTGPKEVVVTSGSCLYVSCRYDLCQAGPSARLTQLSWIHRPLYLKEQREFLGQRVVHLNGTPGADVGNCDLVLPHIREDAGGVYGLRLVAKAARRSHEDLLWMHLVTVNITDVPPAPHLWPDPAPLTHGRKTTFGCWVPPACPEDAPKLIWEGPATNTAGVHVDNWTPPPTVTSHPVIGTLLTFDVYWYHDGSVLSCILQGANGVTITQTSRQLQVNYAPRNVQVQMTLSSVDEGQGVTLSCRSSAKLPPHTFAWTLGGHPLPHRTPQVLLTHVQATDGGSYRCWATNSVGTTESPAATLEVYYVPRELWVEVTPPSPVREGQEVTLSCRAAAHPPPHTFSWTLGGHPLPHHDPQLLLPHVRDTHGGSYGCRATNRLGTAEAPPTALEVYYPPRSAILANLTSLPALAGTRVALRCALGPAHPAPDVQWLRDDRREADALGPALTFQAHPARAGAYRCVGRNPAGTALSPPLNVVVWYPPKTAEVVQSPGGAVVVGGGPVRLRCRVGEGVPPKFEVTWFKDGGELTPPPTSTPTPASSGPEFLLRDPQPEDGAVYVCHARNPAGVTRSAPHVLDVRFGPREVELVPSPSSLVEERSDVTLRCHARARPPPTAFQWFREGRPMGRSPEGLWVMRAVGPRESGRYRCSVTNDIATRHSDDVIVTVYYSTSTILRKTFLGLGVGLSILLVLTTFGCFLRRRWRRQMAADEEPVVEPSGTFFLRNKKPRTCGSPRPPAGPRESDVISYATLMSPPGSAAVPRSGGDTVVYTVLKRSDGAPKATEGPDYENVPTGPSDTDGDREGTLVYAALALSSPGTSRGHGGDVGDTVEYVALKH